MLLTHPTTFTEYSMTYYPAPRDLPSFPTRRSSDLGDARAPQGNAPAQSRARHRDPLAAGTDVGRARPAAVRDRKSTRLNSSHPSSSYAVFCFKKITKTDRCCILWGLCVARLT